MSHAHHEPGCACCTLPNLHALFGGALPSEEVLAQELASAFGQSHHTLLPQSVIFHGGTIYPLVNDDQQVDALGIANGAIVATGSLAQVEAAMRIHLPKKVDLAGRTLLPGFIDPHMHILPSALYRNWVQLTPFTPDVESDHDPRKLQRLNPNYSYGWIKDKIRNAIDKKELLLDKDGEGWLLGFGVDPSLMKEWQDLTATDLDELSTTVPIVLMNSSGHLAYANTKALKKAGLTSPEQANGVLTEHDIADVLVKAGQPSAKQLYEKLKQLLHDAATMGHTTLFDAGLGATQYPLAEVLALKLAGDLGPVRIGAALYTHDQADLTRWLTQFKPELDSQADPRFAIKAIKLIADGSNQGLTGYQTVPYLCSHSHDGKPAHTVPNVGPEGLSNFTPTEFLSLLEQALDAGWPVLVHANGDKAIDYVLASYDQVLTPRPGHVSPEQAKARRQLRPRVEHASLLHDDAIVNMKRLDLSPSFLIGHVGYWGYTFQQTILGEQRAQLLDRCQTATRTGLQISLHTDHFVSPLGPLRMMEQAVFRIMEGAPQGQQLPLNAEEKLGRLDALRAVTSGAAWQCHLDHLVGTLEPGKRADLVILDQDPLDPAVTALRDIAVHETWRGGRTTYSNKDNH